MCMQFLEDHRNQHITDKNRSFEAIYLRSDQGGGHNVFSLKTKQVCNVARVIESPMPQSAIDTVENMAEKEGVPDGITFSDSNNYQVLDDFEFQIGRAHV